MFYTRRPVLLLALLLLAALANSACSQVAPDHRQARTSIPKDKCDEAIAAYVKKTRGWEKGTYEIRFGGINWLTNSATFGVTSNALIEELEKRKHSHEGRILRHHPDDFVVLVDIVDFVVLSENTLDTYFPNAQPGYHRYPFQGKTEKQE